MQNVIPSMSEDCKNIISAVRGDSEEAQFNGLTELISSPTYCFGEMELQRALFSLITPEESSPSGQYIDFTLTLTATY